jgi:hypothetical protein
MKSRVLMTFALASLISFVSPAAFAESPAGIGKEWSKSGFGSNLTYKCKQESCGGPNNFMMVQSFGGISGAPELGVPGGSNLEAEIRRRPEVRRTLAAMLKQLTREGATKGSTSSTTYFANADYAGFSMTFFNAQKKQYLAAQLRINDNKAVLIGGAGETAAAAKRNLNIILPTVKSR